MVRWIDAAQIILATEDGKVLAVETNHPTGAPDLLSFPGAALDPNEPGTPEAFHAAALRGLHERTGFRLELQADGPPRVVSRPQSPSVSADDRARIQRHLIPVGRWVMPEHTATRTNHRVFLCIVEPPETEAPWPTARQWLQRFGALELAMAPPTRGILQALELGIAEAARRIHALPEAHGEEHLDYEPIDGIRQLPLRTPTLPPATTTNTYLIGHEHLLVVDPATYEPDEREKIGALITERLDRGATAQAILLTHHHVDHIGAAQWVADRFGIPIWAHPQTAARLPHPLVVSRALREGDKLNLGRDAAGRPFVVEVLFTPGHAPGHICLVDRRAGTTRLIVGDMVASAGTILIDPSEGDMAEYLAQLARLRHFDKPVLMPAHGLPIVDGNGKLAQYLAHRTMREAKILRALEVTGGGLPAELVEVAYDDTPSHLHPLAVRSCLAHLIKLEKEGRAQRSGQRFRRR